MHISSMVVPALAAVAVSQSLTVQVVPVASANNTLKFFPEKIRAPVGSTVQFQFRAGNHSVVQSTFDQPCVPISSMNSSAVGIFSGYQPVQAAASTGQLPTFSVLVNSTAPIWLYCSQSKHCQKGMVMVINENSQANASRTLENYAVAAKSVTQSQIPGAAVAGGSGSGSGSPPPSNGGAEAGNGGSAAGAGSSSRPTGGAGSLGAPVSLLLAVGSSFLLL